MIASAAPAPSDTATTLPRSINIGVERINLLREDANQYCVNDKALLCFQGLTDRRLTAGVSVRF